MAASNSNTSTASSLLATIAALDQNAVINSALSLPRLDSAALHGLLDLQSEAMLLRSVATSDCKSVIKQQTEAGQAPLTQIEEQLLQASPVPAAVKTEASHDANSPHYTSRPLNIVMLSGGTRGDVQPAVALGLQLAALGHHVRLAADKSFESFVKLHGLEYYPLAGDAKAMMQLTVKWGGMLPTSMSDMWWLRGQIREIMWSTWDAVTKPAQHGDTQGDCLHQPQSFKPDLIIANQLAYGQIHCAEKLGVPLHMVYTIPWIPTTEIAHSWARAFDHNIVEYVVALTEYALTAVAPLSWVAPGFHQRLCDSVSKRVRAWANWGSTPLLDHTSWWGMVDISSQFRRHLGLPVLRLANLGFALYR
eukprot:jgi/Chrzof1/3235/Cz12g16290.t1